MKRRSMLVLVPLILLACEPAQRRAAAPTDDANYALFRQQSAARAEPASARLEAALPMPNLTSLVIRTAHASIEVDSLEPAVVRVRQLAARVNGFIANTEMQTGGGQLRRATLAIKVSATRFDDALAGLAPIGNLESVDVDAADVGEEFVDVTARMDNARRLERRLIDLLATRTGKLKDVLDVEQSLARVREEIERYEGRLRYLKAHTATSTLSVSVHEPVPIIGTAGSSVMGEAFRQSWRNFVTFLAVFVQALGVIVPLGALAVAGWFVARRWRRVISQHAA